MNSTQTILSFNLFIYTLSYTRQIRAVTIDYLFEEENPPTVKLGKGPTYQACV